MIWALLYFYFFGSGNKGLVIDISKPVKKVVLDEGKAKQILELNKAMLKAEADLVKRQKEAGKELAKLNLDRQASEAAFLALHVALEQQRVDVRNQIVEARSKMKEQLTAEQWQAIYQPTDASN